MDKQTTIAQGKFLRLVRKGRWEFAERTNVNGIVVIVPFLNDGRLLFIEQFRPPVDAICIEFPAGLSGDSTDAADEALTSAASRELVEETGYEAEKLRLLGTAAPTAGLTSETMTYFAAYGLTKVGKGGGVEHENIKTHLVAPGDVRKWLAKQAKRATISATVYAGLYLTQH